MTEDEIRAWDHYASGSALYLIVDVGVNNLTLMKVERYAPDAKRKFKDYLKTDFIYLVDEKKTFAPCVPVVK